MMSCCGSVVTLLLLSMVVVDSASTTHLTPKKEYVFEQLRLSVDGISINLTVVSSADDTISILNGQLGVALSNVLGAPVDCEDTPICLEWSDGTKLTISKDGGHYVVEWLTGSARLEDHFDISQAPWYGGGAAYNQSLAIQNTPTSERPLVTGDFGGFSGTVESYWLSSKGAALYVPEDIPLFVSINDNSNDLLTLVSQHADPYKSDTDSLRLKYNILTGSDVRDTHLYAVNTILGKPEAVIDDRVVRDPIWSTWARYKTDINRERILKFADEIQTHNFRYSHLEIDDQWEPCYGKFQFDPVKFPDPAGMISQLHDNGFRVTAWVYPFVDTDCDPFQEVSDNGYFVKDPEGSTSITSWWAGGDAGIIDFTNPAAAEWYVSVLEDLRTSTGLDGFKFDAGETNHLPKSYLLNAPLELQPNIYSTLFVTTVSQFGKFNEVRTGRRTQNIPLMYRMLDKDSSWGYSNGLKTLVTTLLHFNIVGYPFVLPDMIGGNGYGGAPSRELFIRWLQANTFMPVIQYSYVPWDYDDEIIDIARRFTELHSQYADRILELAAKAVTDGTPINPPIWWVDPTDEEAQRIDSEYLLGEDLLVAPVLEEGATSRDIYLPAGTWRDELDPNHPEIEGRTWLRAYPVPLADLAYFTKVA